MKKLRLLLSVYFLVAVSSCRILNSGASIIDFLEDNSRRISIDKAVYSGDFQTDDDGYVSIPSNSDAFIKYLIWNPEGLGISKYGIQTAEGFGLNYINPGPADEEEYFMVDGKAVKLVTDEGNLTDEDSNPLRYTVINENNQSIKMNLPQEFLYRIERSLNGGPGLDFNGALGIVVPDYDYQNINTLIDKDRAENENGNISVNVEPYLPKIRINSPPPPVQGACVMVDGSSSAVNYVL